MEKLHLGPGEPCCNALGLSFLKSAGVGAIVPSSIGHSFLREDVLEGIIEDTNFCRVVGKPDCSDPV